MGGYGGAEIYGLIRIYVLTCGATLVKKTDCRLYKDDGLVILRNANGQ